MIAHLAQWGAMFGGRDNEDRDGGIVGFIFLIILAPLVAMLIQMGISRSREFQADQTGGVISGNPHALASALNKIEYFAKHQAMTDATPATAHLFIINPFSGSSDWVMGLFSTHPSTEQRIARLEELAKRIR
jgi:heat shock protein HtpX